MRCILLILDGLGDKGILELNGLTPLQAARTPNLDAIASSGVNGLYHASIQGIALPSEMAHFSIFGYDEKEFPGRGYIEANGEGIPLGPDDVAILARIFHVEKENNIFVLRKEKISITPEEFEPLYKEVDSFEGPGISLRFHPTGGIGGIITLSGKVSPSITDSNPITEGRPIIKIKPLAKEDPDGYARNTADFLNSYALWAHERLSAHPVNRDRIKRGLPDLNMTGLQRPGRKVDLLPFKDKWGLKPLCIASGSIYSGLCSMLGMNVIKAEETQSPGDDLLERLKMAKTSTDRNFIYVHTKAPDEAAHKRDPQGKIKVIEELDQALELAVREILPDEDILFVITSDHSTASVGTMIHSGESVPLVMHGKYTRRDNVEKFSEIEASAGALGNMRGPEIMYMVLNLMDMGKLKGLMDTPFDQPYTPGACEPLRWLE
jgi:2,3-bisphosphoglycerate-independent phosphoglycerate mutase